jgi:hypothetical protein
VRHYLVMAKSLNLEGANGDTVHFKTANPKKKGGVPRSV